MKAIELIEELNQSIDVGEQTCDSFKCGDVQKEIHKVAVGMFATVDMIKQVKEWGADLFIVHEPTFYDNSDARYDDPVINAKDQLLNESGMALYRYHDHPHSTSQPIDRITEGEIHFLGLKGKVERTPYFASYIFTSETPMTATELCRRMREDLHIAHPRICGSRDKAATKFALCFGTPGGVFDLIRREDIEIIMTGEICEWAFGEYCRDADALGYTKSLIVMGHIGSERDGMRLFTERLQNKYDCFETKYFECGEVYTY